MLSKYDAIAVILSILVPKLYNIYIYTIFLFL